MYNDVYVLSYLEQDTHGINIISYNQYKSIVGVHKRTLSACDVLVISGAGVSNTIPR